MNQLKSPIFWQLIIWIIVLSLVFPVGAVLVLSRNEISAFFRAQEQAGLEEQSQFLFHAISANPKTTQQMLEDFGSDVNSAFILDANGNYLYHSNPQKTGTSAQTDLGQEILAQILNTQSTTVDGSSILKSITIPGAFQDGSILVVTRDSAAGTTALGQITNKIALQLMGFLAIVAVIGGITAILTLITPLNRLSQAASDMGGGKYETDINPEDFVGDYRVLAENLKNLSSATRDSLTEMENRINERTKEIEHRSELLKAVAEVGKAVTSYRNLSELLQQTTHLIHDNFGFYHVGVFLLDEHKEYAVLAASNSEGGQRMLEKNHQLKVGETGIVGYVTENVKARIALDVGKDAAFFNNPDLPETRSEMALPLVASGQVLGALDVQSTVSQAFTEEDVATLQILAEQLAVAIQNANLFSETEKALEASRLVYGEVSREAWSKILRSQPRTGFLATSSATMQIYSEILDSGISKAIDTGDIIIGSDNLTISVPIKVRGLTIGAIRLKKNEISEAWTQDETNLAISLSEQLSGALESARLYRESQARGARESLVSNISSRISASSNVETILRETVQELGQALGKSSVTFELMNQADGQSQAAGQEKKSVNPDTTRRARG